MGVVGVAWLYGVPLECHPDERSILIVFGFGKVGLTAGIHNATDTTAPVFQERSFEEYIGNRGVLWEGMVRLLDSFCGQLIWKMTSVFNLNSVIVDGNAHRATSVVEQPMTKGIRQGFT